MLELNFNPFPELTTERLLLRRLRAEDADEILFLRSDEAVMKYINKEPTATLEDANAFIKSINDNIDLNYVIMWALALKENPGKLIGIICLWRIQTEHYRAEAGFSLLPQFWRQGLIKEALKRVVEYGFNDLKLHSIEGRINPDNAASAATLESAGFVREAYFKEDYCFRGQFLNTAVYSKLNVKSQ
jgi:ribosomal-protein-alanine N-acetyltransferase